MVAERDKVSFAHQTDFQPKLRGLDDGGKHAARVAFPQLRGHAKRRERNARHAVRIDVLGQRAGDFSLELFKHCREALGLLVIGCGGTVDVFECL